MTQQEKMALAPAKNSEQMALGRLEGTLEALRWALGTFGRRAALSSSLSYEDQVVTALMVRQDKDNARIFTLDTGRQFPETYALIDRTEAAYGIRLEVFFPDFAVHHHPVLILAPTVPDGLRVSGVAVHIDFRVAVGEFNDDSVVILVEVEHNLSNSKGVISHNVCLYWLYWYIGKKRAKVCR